MKKIVMSNGSIRYEGKGSTEPPKRIKRKEKIKRLLTDTQASNFYTSVQAFQTTLGRNV